MQKAAGSRVEGRMYAVALKWIVHGFVGIAPLWIVLSNPFQRFLSRVYYQTWCPGRDLLVRDCIARGECGCDNQ